MKRLAIAFLALGLFAASCGNEKPADGNPTIDTAVLVPNNGTAPGTVDTTVHSGTPTMSGNTNGAAGTTTTTTSGGASTTGSATVTTDHASASAAGTTDHSATNGAKAEAAHHESTPASGNVKTKTVIKTSDDGTTKTKTKTETAH